MQISDLFTADTKRLLHANVGMHSIGIFNRLQQTSPVRILRLSQYTSLLLITLHHLSMYSTLTLIISLVHDLQQCSVYIVFSLLFALTWDLSRVEAPRRKCCYGLLLLLNSGFIYSAMCLFLARGSIVKTGTGIPSELQRRYHPLIQTLKRLRRRHKDQEKWCNTRRVGDWRVL